MTDVNSFYFLPFHCLIGNKKSTYILTWKNGATVQSYYNEFHSVCPFLLTEINWDWGMDE